MTSGYDMRLALSSTRPYTHKAFTELTTAFAYGFKCITKRTWFGADQSSKAYSKIGPAMVSAAISLVADGLADETDSADSLLDNLIKEFNLFRMAYPSWPDAYGMADVFFEDNRELALIAIRRAKGEL